MEEKFEDTVEGVHYDFSDRINGLGDEQRNNKNLIIKTLLRIPKKCREKLLYKDVTFCCISEGTEGLAECLYLPFNRLMKEGIISYLRRKNLKPDDIKNYKLNSIPSMLKFPIIILNFDRMKKNSDTKKMNTIAHEIAHVILGDFGVGENSKAERNADDLIVKWGFKRAYKIYDKFEN